ncbi:hypothetical protein [Streptomyces tirandamycinicus]|uniref:Glycosyltransferase RgtA/B/C/D-like domain-containing protein n=1 Tax=Streptomyces tirandamycinicus TaxID=2174846 RepID=A0A2S1T1E8_9ACTN|nr:hypothetical protein [Streptomyces tirandamycinicus]AWI32482.1 hypothetical protein DDW44_29525 [Streptomyces tirandamycinicus]
MEPSDVLPGHRDGVPGGGGHTSGGASGRADRLRARARRWPWPPLAVAAVFTLVQLVLSVPGVGLGWDETVYVSQVSTEAPAAFFSAPRARGITYLVAPFTAVTPSVAALRVCLAVLSGCALFVALRAWRGLLPTVVAATGGALFAGLWVTVFYGPQVMPNLWVAFGALAAVGCFLRAARDSRNGGALTGLGAAVAFTALMRPADAVWLVLPLAAAALVLRVRHRIPLIAAPAAGAALGWAGWIAEAYLRYGGLGARLRRASEIQGHLGLHFAVDDHVRALGGRTLCRPCDVAWQHPAASLWFLALPVIVAAGVLAARRTAYRTEIAVATAAGVSMAVPYLFTVDYAAPRFLLPAYALLALPAAVALVAACRARPRGRAVFVCVLAAAVAGHLWIQYRLLDGVTNRVRSDTVAFGRVAAELRAQGVWPPCVVAGEEAVRVAFRTGCASRQPSGHDESITPAALARAAMERPVVVLVSGGKPPPAFARGWREHRLPDLRSRAGHRAYLSPAADPGRPSR